MARPDEERRIVVGELRAEGGENGAPTKIVGYAARFNSLSGDLGGFQERIAPGAFAKTVVDGDVRALWNHDANIVLGRNKSGTLRMTEDEMGLHYECDAPDTQLVRDMVMSPIARGDVNQCSFGFRTISDQWDKQANGEWIRTLLEVELFDVSPVTYPAYESTTVAVRSLDKVRNTQSPDTEWRDGLMAKRLELESVT